MPFGIFDYNLRNDYLHERVLSVISSKQKQYNTWKNKKTIEEDTPYIIFISAGMVAPEFMINLKNDINKVFYGLGHPVIQLDKKSLKQIGVDYTRHEKIINLNSSTINTNLFCREEYSFISAIIFVNPTTFDNYNYQNTYIYINPFSKNKFNLVNFNNFSGWYTENAEDTKNKTIKFINKSER
jgi:hypothetical protein